MPFHKTGTVSTTTQGEIVNDESWKTGYNQSVTTDAPTTETSTHNSPVIKEHTTEKGYIGTQQEVKAGGGEKSTTVKSPSSSVSIQGPGRTTSVGGAGHDVTLTKEDAVIRISFKLRITHLNKNPVCP